MNWGTAFTMLSVLAGAVSLVLGIAFIVSEGNVSRFTKRLLLGFVITMILAGFLAAGLS